MGVHIFNPITWEAETDLSETGQSGLHTEFQDSRDYSETVSRKKEKMDILILYLIVCSSESLYINLLCKVVKETKSVNDIVLEKTAIKVFSNKTILDSLFNI